jgi:hypothetical protein
LVAGEHGLREVEAGLRSAGGLLLEGFGCVVGVEPAVLVGASEVVSESCEFVCDEAFFEEVVGERSSSTPGRIVQRRVGRKR